VLLFIEWLSICSFIGLYIRPFLNSFIHSLTYSPLSTHSVSLTHLLPTDSLTDSLTDVLTYSPTHSHFCHSIKSITHLLLINQAINKSMESLIFDKQLNQSINQSIIFCQSFTYSIIFCQSINNQSLIFINKINQSTHYYMTLNMEQNETTVSRKNETF